MTVSVLIAAGEENIVLPNGKTYEGGDIVNLTDEEYADLDADAIGTVVLSLSDELGLLNPSAPNVYVYRRYIELASITDAGDVDTFTPGFAGKVVATRYIPVVPVTTASKAVTLNLEIGATNVTGGQIQLDSGNTGQLGNTVSGMKVTAANVFDSDDILTLEAGTPTDFLEGAGIVEVVMVADTTALPTYRWEQLTTGLRRLTIPLTLASLADGDVMQFTPGFAGSVLAIRAIATTVASTASKASTLNLEIGSTNLTGGAVALTTAGLNVLGETVDGSAVTAANAFVATDVLTLEASSTTTFIEGEINFEVLCSVT